MDGVFFFCTGLLQLSISRPFCNPPVVFTLLPNIICQMRSGVISHVTGEEFVPKISQKAHFASLGE